MKNSHLHLLVHYTVSKVPERQMVFCLGRDQEMKADSTSNFFISKDYGETYTDESRKFKIEERKINATIAHFYYHPL